MTQRSPRYAGHKSCAVATAVARRTRDAS